jgi:hypothetical protein
LIKLVEQTTSIINLNSRSNLFCLVVAVWLYQKIAFLTN